MIGIELSATRVRVLSTGNKDRLLTLADAWPNELRADTVDANAAWLKGQLKSAGIDAGEAVAILSRGLVQVKAIRVPVVPDAELPSVVAFAAETIAHQPGISYVIDYQPGPIHAGTADDGSDQLEVLAAVASADIVDVVKRLLQKAGVSLKRLGVRPWGARVFHPGRSDAASDVLCHVTTDLMEVAVWTQAQLRICRWIPLTSPVSVDRLSNELKRTLAAFSAENHDEPVDAVALIGAGLEAFESTLAERTGLAVTHVAIAATDASDVSLLGAIRSAEGRAPWAIDLLRPKKAGPPVDQKRRQAIIGSTAAVLIAAAALFSFNRQLAAKQSRIDALRSEIAQISTDLTTYKPVVDRHNVIQNWVRSGDPIIEELQEVAGALPDTTDMFLTGLEYTAGQSDQPGTIKIDGVAREQSTITRAQAALAGNGPHRYDVVPRGIDPGADVGSFVWRFGLDLRLKSLTDFEYAQRSPHREKMLQSLNLPDGKKREPISLARKSTAATNTPASATPAKAKPAAGDSPETADASESAGDFFQKKVDELKKLPAAEREAAVAKEKKFLQKRLRKALEGAR
jgi:Tfp pilus assembly PilM family ATPase